MKRLRRQQFSLFAIDIVLVILTLLFTLGVRTRFHSIQTDWPHLALSLFLLSLWMVVSVMYEKFRLDEQLSLRNILKSILRSNLIILAVASIVIILVGDMHISRYQLFGSFLFITLIEFLQGLTVHNIQHSHFIQEWIGSSQFNEIRTNGLIPPPELKQQEFPKVKQALLDGIIEVSGKEACEWLSANAQLDDTRTLLLDTSSRFNLLTQPDNHYNEVVNINTINDIRRINLFFETVNEKLPLDGIFIGCGETYWTRRRKIMQKYPPVINKIVIIFDFIYHRLLPKLTLTNKLYFLLSRGKNRGIPRAEMLGRLVSCGFGIVEERPIGNLLYFKTRKIREPYYDKNPSYGLLIRLRRVGQNGNEFNVFKLRTMHAYSEYIQGYCFKNNGLARGGKIGQDFRVTAIGQFLRRYWIDEIPMLINLLRGDIKIIGVRPLSRHYFNLYSETLQQARIRHKPGLIPPYYAQFPPPKTLEEIEQNELEYLRRCAKHPYRTDFIYFHRALYNIIFHRCRSK